MGLFENFINKKDSIEGSFNFKYLDNLIRGGLKEITLNNDIALDENESNDYSAGITVDGDDLVIDGNGHSIDARGKARIFKILAKNVTIKNVVFKNGFEQNGGAVYVEEGSSCLFKHCRFEDNTAKLRGGAIVNFGAITLENSAFERNTANDEGGAVDIQLNASIEIIDTEITNNTAPYGGAIINFGQATIEHSKISENIAHGEGGAIFNEKNSSVAIKDTKILHNTSKKAGGAIINYGEVSFRDTEIEGNSSQLGGGAINNQMNALIRGENSVMSHNSSQAGGGGILNHGKIIFRDVVLLENTSKRGGALNNQISGTMNIEDCEIAKNSAAGIGGSIYNKNNMMIAGSILKNNFSNEAGGAIYNEGEMEIQDSELSGNDCEMDGCVIYNENKTVKLVSCEIIGQNSKNNLISNDATLTCIESNFNDNTTKIVLNNNETGILDISNGEFKNNNISTTIHNKGKAYLSDSTFKDNTSKSSQANDIINENYMKLTGIKFMDDFKTVLNEGTIETKKLSKEKIETNIDNQGNIDIGDYIPHKKECGFMYLQDFIDENGSRKLEYDVQLKNYEIEFYEGGIEIHQDNLVIDGNNKVIDANNKSRIFLITGKNITLKNFIFKNGYCQNNFDSHVTGGGAIQIVKDASLNLENCRFIGNSTTDDGGAIFNNGTLHSKANEFKGNASRLFGGAIYNLNVHHSEDDTFEDNEAKIGGAIYNRGQLNIENQITASGNQSVFTQPIYNADGLQISNASMEYGELVYDTNAMNQEPSARIETYSYLQESIEASNKVILESDIHHDYGLDRKLEYILTIEKDELTLDGNGHTIDGKNAAALFNILGSNGRILIKNLTFKDIYSSDSHIIDNFSDLTIENCTFLNCTPSGDVALINNHNSIRIVNSNFYNNFSKRESIIKNTRGIITIIDSNFINNSTDENGGVINNIQKDKITDSPNEVRIENCEFICNGAKKMGGAIFNRYGIIKIINSKLAQNASSSGGAIKNYGEIVIENSQLHANSSKLNGGAIVNENEGSVTIKDSVVSANSSDKSGGFIITFGHATIDHSEVNENTSKGDGGAILNQGELLIKNSSFKQNEAALYGGVIASKGSMTIQDTMFNDNSSLKDGGAILNQESGSRITNAIFNNNAADGFGGAITNIKGVVEISDAILNQNGAASGGAIATLGLTTMKNVTFSLNAAKENGGAVWAYSKDFISEDNCRFIGNNPNDVVFDN